MHSALDLVVDKPILIVECIEPEGTFQREVRLASITADKLRWMYNRLKKFKVLFSDFTRADPDAFVNRFFSIDGAGVVSLKGFLFDVDDVGIFFFDNVTPKLSADVHITFWDQRLKGRENLVKEVIKYFMEIADLHRVSFSVPAYSKATVFRIKRAGFVHEGTLREAALWEEKWHDVHIFGILRQELINDAENQDGADQIPSHATS